MLGWVALLVVAPTAAGPTGLLHTPSALPNEAGVVRSAVYVDWFRASRFLGPNDEHTHSGATASLGATFVRGLDAYVVGRAYSNSSSLSPDVHYALGDTTLGAKYTFQHGRFALGAATELLLFGGPGSVGYGAVSFRERALLSYALPRVNVHLGLSYLFDNTALLVADVERERRTELTRVERYGLGINRVDRFEASLGVELPTGTVTPFVELGLGLPVHRQRARCTEGCSAFPSRVTLGARAGARGVSFLLGLDLGTSGVTRAPSTMTPQAPWTLWLGFALTLDTREHPRESVVERIEPEIAFVPMRGYVHAGDTPIPNARVTFVGSDRPPLMTDDKGRFGADLPPGTYELRIRAEGYRENTCGGTAVAVKGNVLTIECPLEPLP